MLEEIIKESAKHHGFYSAGICSAGQIEESSKLARWIETGLHGEMNWMKQSIETRGSIRNFHSDTNSVIVLAMPYGAPLPLYSESPPDPDECLISRHAWGKDYHEVVKKSAEEFIEEIKSTAGEFSFKISVDSSPVMEKVYARKSGIGWVGKNTLILNEVTGSWMFLAVIPVSLKLEPDNEVPNRCGNCTACIDACPTGAISPNGILDAGRCISYLTIEYRGKIPSWLREKLGSSLFGCDICQEACPYNKNVHLPVLKEFLPIQDFYKPKIRTILKLTEGEFQRKFKGTTIFRRGLGKLKETASLIARM
jgi:epoxyqueuosine reductase